MTGKEYAEAAEGCIASAEACSIEDPRHFSELQKARVYALLAAAHPVWEEPVQKEQQETGFML